MDDGITGAALGGGVLIISAIWGAVGLLFYVWYLWSLSRLFPKIGLPAGYGWIPLWNLWQLIQRGGLPGWIAILGIIPGINIVTLVVTIMAIHRINSEYGKGGGFTVLGALLPPVWAMMLTSHIVDSGYSQSWEANQPGAMSGQLPYAVGPDGYGQPEYAAAPMGFQQEFQPDPAAGGWQGMPPVQQDPDAGGWQGMPPVAANPAEQSGLAGQIDPAWQVDPVGPPQGYGPPQEVPQRPGWTAPARPADQNGAYPAMVPPEQVPPVGGPAALGFPPETFQAPDVPAPPGTVNDWGFSNTTEGAFERLASEGALPHGDAPLGVSSPPQELYSWPAVTPEPPLEATAVTPAVPVAPPAPVTPAADPEPPHAPASAAVEPAAPLPPLVLPGPPEVGSVAAALDPEPAAPIVAAPMPAPPMPAPGEAVSAASIPPAAIPVEAAETPSIFDAPQVPQEFPAVPVPPPAPAVGVGIDEIDHTVVVARQTRWGLELPDGEVLELLGDEIVVGRKPEAVDGSTALQIPDPTRTMSKTHARMRRVGDVWTIEDMNSTNGVAVYDGLGNSVQLEAGRESAVLERMIIGTLEVRLRLIG